MNVTITAHMLTPTIGHVGPLDGALAWACAQRAMERGEELEPISDDHAPDFPLPLEKWEQDGVWGWKVSAPIFDTSHYSATEIRRRPATGAMALFTKAKDHHSGLGPTKAGNTTLSTTYHRKISWHATITNEDELRSLLGIVTNLGARHRNGFGKVAEWEITPGPAGGWKQRPLPDPHGQPMRTRAPYWHPTERTPCA